jgi:ribonuclease HIII
MICFTNTSKKKTKKIDNMKEKGMLMREKNVREGVDEIGKGDHFV